MSAENCEITNDIKENNEDLIHHIDEDQLSSAYDENVAPKADEELVHDNLINDETVKDFEGDNDNNEDDIKYEENETQESSQVNNEEELNKCNENEEIEYNDNEVNNYNDEEINESADQSIEEHGKRLVEDVIDNIKQDSEPEENEQVDNVELMDETQFDNYTQDVDERVVEENLPEEHNHEEENLPEHNHEEENLPEEHNHEEENLPEEHDIEEDTTEKAEEHQYVHEISNQQVDLQEEVAPEEISYESTTEHKNESFDNEQDKETNEMEPSAKDIKSLTSNYESDNLDNQSNSYCYECKKIVYPLEKLSTKNGVYHKACFRCTKCRKTLTPANISFNKNKPYCTPHYLELFKKRGKYDEDTEEINESLQNTQIQSHDTVDDSTNEMPAPDTTKSLVANIENRTVDSRISGNKDDPEFLPPRDTTKKLMEKFTALSTTNGHNNSNESIPSKHPEPINIHAEYDSSNGHHQSQTSDNYENQPRALDENVVRSDEPQNDERPKQGTAKALASRFNSTVSAN